MELVKLVKARRRRAGQSPLPISEQPIINGRRHSGVSLEPWTVYGGYRMAWAEWVYDGRDGWDHEHSTRGLPDTVFKTEDACWAAIDALRSSQQEGVAA